MKTIPEDQLRNSPVVANCCMNRKRQLVGINSYANELGFDPGERLVQKSLNMGEKVRWLDLCCGEGNALVGLAQRIAGTEWEDRLAITGVDLVGMFVPWSDKKPLGLNLVESALEDWVNPHESCLSRPFRAKLFFPSCPQGVALGWYVAPRWGWIGILAMRYDV